MPALVADASTVAAAVFEEPDSEPAERVLAGAELYEPTLLRYELINIALNKSLEQPQDRGLLALQLESALGLGFQWRELPATPVLALALQTGLTAYDASYLYLAMALGLPLATFDRNLRSAASGRVQLL